MADNATTARKLYDTWNARDFEYAASITAPDAQIITVGTGDTLTGPDGVRQYGRTWADAFPDGTVTIDTLVADGDHVVVEFTGRGTHTGDLVTSMGTIPATGRSLTLHLCDVYTFRDGKVVQQNAYFDTGSLMAQLGVSAEQLSAAQRG